MKYWVYKVNSKQSHEEFLKRAYGDWRDFFKKSGEQEWGGTWATGDHNSLRFLREEMVVGDLIFAYQTNLSSIIGLARITDLYRYPDDDGNEGVELYLEAHEPFTTPVPILRLKRSDGELAAIRAFQPNSLGTLHALSDGDSTALLKACRAYQRQSPRRSNASKTKRSSKRFPGGRR